MEIKECIRNYFAKSINTDIHDGDDIFALGLVNSLFAMQLVMFVEKEFMITAENDDLNINNFCSINALTAFVERKSAATGFRHGY